MMGEKKEMSWSLCNVQLVSMLPTESSCCATNTAHLVLQLENGWGCHPTTCVESRIIVGGALSLADE